MAKTLETAVAVIGIDIGKNSFHVVGLDQRGAIVLRQKWSRGQVEARFANMPPCLPSAPEVRTAIHECGLVPKRTDRFNKLFRRGNRPGK